MNLIVNAKLNKVSGELINYSNGTQILDVNLTDINTLSDEKKNRFIGIDKDLYRLTAKSYVAVKKELNKANLMWRIGLTKA